jgi:hypothetical protein
MAALTQINRAVRGLPISAAPAFVAAPYAVPDVQAGDASRGVIPSTTGFPLPTVSASVAMSDGTTHAHPYTFQTSDIGKTGTFTVSASSVLGSATATATPFTVKAPLTAVGQNLLGSNTTRPLDYEPGVFLNNAGQCGRVFWFPGTNTTGVPVDANGWPTVAFDYLITSQIGTDDGQLPNGTRPCSIRSVGQATAVTCAGGTISNVTLDADGVTTHFQLVTPAATNVTLKFSGPIQYLDIPRDGVTPTYGGPEFYPPAVAHFASMAAFRTMDVAWTNYRTGEINWSDRPPERGVTAPSFGGYGSIWSHERLIRFINAVAAYPGSKLKLVHYNIPGLVTTAYAASCATLLNSNLSAPGVSIRPAYGNEQWNSAAPAPNYFSLNSLAACADARTVAGWVVSSRSNYGPTDAGGSGFNNIASVSRVSNVVTVTTTNALNPAIVNGATPLIDHLTDSSWNAGIPGATGGAQNAVTGFTVLSPTSFSYTQPQTAADATLTSTTGQNLGFYFNPSSTIVADATTYDINSLYIKYYVRALAGVSTAWRAVRPQDKFCLEWQQYGNGGWSAFRAGMTSDPVFVRYANWFAQQSGGGSATLANFVDSIAIAPYTHLTTQYYSMTAGSNQVLGVPYASEYVSGDAITVSGAGTSGGTLTTTVVSGSGTTLTVADNAVTSATYGQVKPLAGANNATFAASWKGYADTFGLQALHAQAYITTKYGLKSIAYEGANESPTADLPAMTDAQAISLNASAGIGTNFAHIMDNWFSGGHDEFFSFSNAPGWADDPFNFQLKTWTDTTSPKVAAFNAYTGNRVYSNINSDGAGGCICYAKWCIATGASLSNANPSYPATSAFPGTPGPGGVLNWPTNTVERYADWPIVIDRAGTYQVILNACDSSVGTTAHIRIDDFTTDVGTVIVLGTGAGDSATSAPADSAPLLVTFTQRGRHNLRVRFPPTGTDGPGTGVRAGIAQVRVVPLA